MKGSKICGISDPDTLNYIINHPYPSSFIGFIVNYSQSPRFVKLEKLKELRAELKSRVASEKRYSLISQGLGDPKNLYVRF